ADDMSGCGRCSTHCSHSDVSQMGVNYSLYTKIDIENVQCLNEVSEGSGKLVFKPWEDRLHLDKYVESDADEELLFNVPFTGNVKLKGMIVIGGEDGSHPSSVKLYKNRPQMTFDETSTTPDQEFELTQDHDGTYEYTIKTVKFSSVTNLSIYFPNNFGSDSTKVYYIGLKGEFTPVGLLINKNLFSNNKLF
ncbi:PITH domain-containing protein-like protein, partial [Dinothrombium tinctorium]